MTVLEISMGLLWLLPSALMRSLLPGEVFLLELNCPASDVITQFVECAACWRGFFIAGVFKDVILHHLKLFRGCLLWCRTRPLFCSPAALVLELCHGHVSIGGLSHRWKLPEWEHCLWDALICLKSTGSLAAQLVGTWSSFEGSPSSALRTDVQSCVGM